MAITGFICHDDYFAKTAKLTDEEVGRLFRALMVYHSTGEAPALDGRESVAFDFICEDIDKAEQRYRDKCEQNRRNRLGAGEKEKERQITDDNERQQPSTIVKEKTKRFVPPTYEEVSIYCIQRGNMVDAQRFYDYYCSNGWKVGKNQMKDWKAAVRTWERSELTKQEYERKLREMEEEGIPI